MITAITIPSDGGFFTFPNESVKLTNYNGFGIPDAKKGSHEYSNADGGLFLSHHYRTRRIALLGFINCTDKTTFSNVRKEFFQAFSFLNEEKLLKFTLEDGRTLQCLVGGVGRPTDDILGPVTSYFAVELDAADPILYSQDLYTAQGGVATLTGTGFTLPFTLPLVLSGSVTGVVTVLNKGNFRVHPTTITITGPCTNFTVSNKTTNQNLSYNGTLLAGDSIVIDTKRKTAVKNGITNVYGDMTGDWWDLYYGSNSIALTVGSGNTSATGITVQWRDGYIGF